jgi:hypothetical protein
MIALVLEGGPRRFSEIEAAVDHQVTPKVLTESLRAMARDGFVTRTAEGRPPARRVTYVPARSTRRPRMRSALVPRDRGPESAAARHADSHSVSRTYSIGRRARAGGSRPASSQPAAAATSGSPSTITARWTNGTCPSGHRSSM